MVKGHIFWGLCAVFNTFWVICPLGHRLGVASYGLSGGKMVRSFGALEPLRFPASSTRLLGGKSSMGVLARWGSHLGMGSPT